MTLSEPSQLHPKQSADAFVLLYSGAKYFRA
jgi:cobalamin-dependent methionine synthase I